MRRSLGFTLIELMVTIAVLAVIATMAAPSFTATIRKNQLLNDVNDFQNNLKDVRSTALLSQRDQLLSLDPSVSNAWKPQKQIKWNPTPATTPITYNMMGRLKSDANLCFILQHKDDSNLKAVIVVRRSGLVIYDKARLNCLNLGDD
ncbi:prepilin-type N-terminal cleavage/methylation domain-containing protein [Acinetobacter ursingii]|uniref:pilus assembly FimT family protein n=1 Tax=Acinetobacter ursingii TaxID=108980 RepID=UPI0022EADEF1|nr:prepilin-type N-terminal cleavage/methylation domain-containing protein [Acinetobacter ursingii]MDA3579931.1 prepilin-type N-terminal cleavage/methylation domain-containing protein [Acinetobacter ursingii]MDH0809198.1 prepilin-type N-terminal cleavage/methylation domain-containing protein [Acinetobacter ursingii]MDH2019474.1 prepilin-type N-terminal cleavage/methylation domain-containing protein [Acinetobacter ursingii]MDH2071260.1 prepilin-type N-terminal cleavage/methylation domain-contain